MAHAQSKPNWFVIGISAAVVVVLIALGAVVVWMNNKATDAGPAPTGAIINADTGAITYGGGDKSIDTYIDFMCPACNAFEQSFGADLQKAASEDKITLNVHPIAILDHLSQGTNYSSRAAAAMYCVAENNPDQSLDYLNTLFASQPQEGTTGLTDDQLKEIATQVGADKAASCIDDKTYLKFGAAQAKAHSIQGTPSVDIDGKRLDMPMQQIYTEVEKFIKSAV